MKRTRAAARLGTVAAAMTTAGLLSGGMALAAVGTDPVGQRSAADAAATSVTVALSTPTPTPTSDPVSTVTAAVDAAVATAKSTLGLAPSTSPSPSPSPTGSPTAGSTPVPTPTTAAPRPVLSTPPTGGQERPVPAAADATTSTSRVGSTGSGSVVLPGPVGPVAVTVDAGPHPIAIGPLPHTGRDTFSGDAKHGESSLPGLLVVCAAACVAAVAAGNAEVWRRRLASSLG